LDNKKKLNDLSRNVKSLLGNNIRTYNALNGQKILGGNSFDDLGDYLPLFIYLNDAIYIDKHIDLFYDALKKTSFLYKGNNNNRLFLNRCYEHSDLLWGLIILCQFYPKNIEKFEKTFNLTYEYFFVNIPYLFRWSHIPYTNIKIPQKISPGLKILSSQDHGMFIEIFVNLFKLTKKEKWLNAASNLFNVLDQNKFFKKNLYFSYYDDQNYFLNKIIMNYKGFKKHQNEFQLVKQNSNTLFAILNYFEIANKAEKEKILALLEKVFNSWEDKFWLESNKVFFTNFKTDNNSGGSDLTIFHLIELLISTNQITKNNRLLNWAEKITNSILKLKGKTGLLPFLNPNIEQHIKRMKLSKKASWLDSEVDFGVSLIKLSVATNNLKYFSEAKLLLNAIVKNHSTKFGYVSSVHIDSGVIMDPRSSTKMTSLVVKLFIAIDFAEQKRDHDILNHILLQDR